MMKAMKRAWTNSSLRTKWFYSIAVTIVGVYAAVCIIIYAALYAWLSENEKGNAVRTVDDLQGYFSSQSVQISVNDLQQQTGLMKAILTQEQTVRLYSLDGVELLQINDFSSRTPLLNETSRTIEQKVVDDQDVYVVQDVITIGRSAVMIQLIHPLTSFQAMMQYIVTTMLIMGIGALLLSGVISYFLAGHFVKPLLQLRNSMLQVKERGVSANTLTVEHGKDELGDVLHIYNEMLEQLDESFQRQQQFVFDASHELRTPIQAIEGNLKLIQRWGKDDEEVLEESLRISLDEIARMKKLMEELLQLARQQKVDYELALNIVPVIEQLKTEYAPFIHVQIEVENCLIAISEQALVQITRNLIENSLRYCSEEPNIIVKLKKQEQFAELTIVDNGVGIAQEHLPYIFDRFYRADDARLHVEGSTGLGLSIVKMLVEKYGGRIFVQSEIEKGSTFILRFPIKK